VKFESLGELHGRQTVRCLQCKLVQFVTERNHCRRCKVSFEEPIVPPEPKRVQRIPIALPPIEAKGLNVAGAVRICREALGLSQRDVEALTGMRRTYISKIENRELLTPNLKQCARLAKGFGVPMSFFATLCEVPGL
jgi:ribosome-binding protein aMBF1 (putative translation factor)